MVEPDVPGIAHAADTSSDGSISDNGAAQPWEAEGGAFGSSPELFVGAAFVGGLVLARVLRRLGR